MIRNSTDREACIISSRISIHEYGSRPVFFCSYLQFVFILVLFCKIENFDNMRNVDRLLRIFCLFKLNQD